jgi:hypothetical protein
VGVNPVTRRNPVEKALAALYPTHMKSILPKLDANDRTHAVMIALKRGILDV